VDGDLHEGWALGAEAPHQGSTLAIGGLRRRPPFALVMGCSPASSRRTTCRRRRSRITLPPGSTFSRPTRHCRAGARRWRPKNKHVKLVYTAIGGGSAGGDPFAMPSARPSAQGHADDQHDAARRPPRHQQAGHRAQLRDATGKRCRRAAEGGFGGSSEKYQLVLAGEDGERAGRHAAGREGTAHHGRHRRRSRARSSLVRPELIVRPGRRARRRPGRVTPRPSPTRCASPPPATTTRRCPSSTCRSARCRSSCACPTRRAPTSTCCRACSVPGARGPVPLRQVASCNDQRPGADRPL
jgi:hypothetical protein